MEARAGMLAQLFSRATDKVRCREARLSEEKGRLLRGTRRWAPSGQSEDASDEVGP